MSKRNIGIFNPNSRNQTRACDEDMSPVNLPPRRVLEIKIEATRMAINSVKGLEDHLSLGWLDGTKTKLAELEKELKELDAENEHTHLIGLGVDFDITAMGEAARVRSDEIKARMDARMEETKRRNHRGNEIARKTIIGVIK